MKYLINSVLRRAGVQIVRVDTIDRLRAEVVELRESRPFLDNVYGHRIYVDQADIGLRLANFVGLQPEKSEDRFFVQRIRPGEAVLDLGANVGLYSLLFAKLVGPSGSVLAFEPGPKSFKLLERNIKENGYKNIQAENSAVTDYSGAIDLFVCPTGESDNRVSGAIDYRNNWERVSVPCVAMDDYLAGRKIDLVKMDIQGSEFAALRGMRDTLRNPSIKIAMEFSPELIDDKPAFFSFVREVGLSLFDMSDKALSPEQLLARVGNSGQPAHVNIVLRR